MGGSDRANAVSGWLLVLALGCSAHHGRDDLVVGRDPQAGSGAAQAGAPDRNSSASASGGRRALIAAIQNREGVTLDVVTVGCAGSCYEVVAVARGGYPPYSYQWEDGSSEAARTLCPAATGVFSVVAQDRGYSSEEFRREPETVEAKVTAEVLACPDAGPLDAGIPPVADASTPDAGSEPTPPPLRPLCIENGSFEDDPNGAPWLSCPVDEPAAGYMFTEPATPFGVQPIDGARYVRLDATPVRGAAISQKLCEPVVAGTRYYWSVSMALDDGSTEGALEIFLSKSPCGVDDGPGDFQLDAPQGWGTSCSQWDAPRDADYVTVRAITLFSSPVTVYVDQFQAVSPTCPAPEL